MYVPSESNEKKGKVVKNPSALSPGPTHTKTQGYSNEDRKHLEKKYKRKNNIDGSVILFIFVKWGLRESKDQYPSL